MSADRPRHRALPSPPAHIPNLRVWFGGVAAYDHMSLRFQCLRPAGPPELNQETPMKPHPFAGLAALSFSAAVLCQPQAGPPQALQQATQAPPQPTVTVKDYDVFVDPPTGFVFVKLPKHWKFVGKVDETALASLPSTVITSLLPDERDGVVASDNRQAPSRR